MKTKGKRDFSATQTIKLSVDLTKPAPQRLEESKLKSKLETRIKAFTSQIQDLPGPKKHLVRNVGEDYENEEKQASKLAEEKNRLKSNGLYGSYY